MGNYVIPGTTETGGLSYDMTTGLWTAMPVATENGANYPDAVSYTHLDVYKRQDQRACLVGDR